MDKYSPDKTPDHENKYPSPDKFVDRETERNLVMEKVKQLREGISLERSTIIFTGTRGIGKTCLLKYLYEAMQGLSNVVSILLQLPAREEVLDHTLVLMDIFQQIGAVIEKPFLGGETPTERGRQLVDYLPQNHALVILIDAAYESNWELLAAFEEFFLTRAVLMPNTLIVMTGRGREFPWKAPELRLRAEQIELQPFSVDDTIEQLKNLHGDSVPSAPTIHNLSGGNPLVNQVLLANPIKPEKELIRAIDEILSMIPQVTAHHNDHTKIVELLAQVSNQNIDTLRDYVRTCLEALCVLRSFDDDERIGAMIAGYFYFKLTQQGLTHEAEQVKAKLAQWDFPEFQQLRMELMTEWGLVRWDKSQGGYVLDESIRELIERYLRIYKYDLWVILHRTAATLYDNWIKNYPKQRERWRNEANYHHKKIEVPASDGIEGEKIQ